MTKEKQIISQYSLTKQQLLDARASREFQEGVDWVRGSGTGPQSAVSWTPGGLSKLLKSKNVDVALTGNISSKQTEETKVVANLPKEASEVVKASTVSDKPIKASQDSNVACPGIVKQKYPNRKQVRCEIRGESHIVLVKDSHYLRLGSIITVKKRGDNYVSHFKVDGMGRIHG